jgi:uncharacterized protein YbjT (DUF2867 family)
MPQPVFLTGGTGFVGSAVIEELSQRNYQINALVNRQQIQKPSPSVKPVQASLFDVDALSVAMADCSAVIHLVGIIMEKPRQTITFERMHVQATRCMVDAATKAGVSRYVQMSALGTRPGAVSEYHKTKWIAEECVRASSLNWTILRPSMIHGPSGDLMQMEINWARKQAAPYFFMPYFGKGILGLGGSTLLQPIFVNDVARAFADCLKNPSTEKKSYDLGGAERLTWPQMHRGVAEAVVGKPRATGAIPAWYASALTTVLPASWLPFNRSQVQMSMENNTCEMDEIRRDFGWMPGGFAETFGSYSETFSK